MSFLFRAARFLGAVCQFAFLFSVDSSYDLMLTLLSCVGLQVCDVLFCVLLFSSRGLPLCGGCVVCTNGCVGPEFWLPNDNKHCLAHIMTLQYNTSDVKMFFLTNIMAILAFKFDHRSRWVFSHEFSDGEMLYTNRR